MLDTERYLAKVALLLAFIFVCGLVSGVMDWLLILGDLAWFFLPLRLPALSKVQPSLRHLT